MWFTENPWPPIVISAALGLLLLAAGLTGRGKRLIPVGIVLLLDCPIFWFVEQAIVTDGERVEQRVLDMGQAFVRNDLPGTLAFFDPQNLELTAAITSAVALVDLTDLTFKDMSVRDPGTRVRTLTSRFRANANVDLQGVGDVGHHPSRWELDWQQRNGQWVIVAVRRFDVIRDEEIPLMSRD